MAPDDFKDESQLDANDFLIRGIIGMDPKGGAIAVGDTVGVGKRIRFMVSVIANGHLQCTTWVFVCQKFQHNYSMSQTLHVMVFCRFVTKQVLNRICKTMPWRIRGESCR